MKRLTRTKLYPYKGGMYRVNGVFMKRYEVTYYWAYNVVTKEFIILHGGML